MTTASLHINSVSRHGLRLAAVAAALLAAFTFGALPRSAPFGIDPELLEGRAPTAEELRPSVEAAFQAESYKPGTVASLKLFNHAKNVTVQIFQTGPETVTTVGNSEMQGVPVTGVRRIGTAVPGRTIKVTLGSWVSGVYFARLTCAGGRIGFAPFLLAPAHLGVQRVAVVEPTMTWQAYNLRDDNGDGKGDSWYGDWRVKQVHLYRPFLDRGVPYHFRNYDLPFLHWMAQTGHQADFFSDADIDALGNPAQLASVYDLIIFPGHHEYVTTHEYAIVRGYRDHGGNLAFLSANNFFWQVLKQGNTLTRTEQWRDLDVPEAALIGVQYRANDDGQHRGPWVVTDTEAAPWLFAGTGLRDGDTFGNGGIEIDKTSDASPANIHVLAEIPNLLGNGLTAQMAYYETARGAKVFASGAFTLAGSVLQPTIGQLVANLWTHLSQP